MMMQEELTPELQELLQQVKLSAIRPEVKQILHKLWRGEQLTRSELAMDVTPAEVAALWSVANKTPIETWYVREVKCNGRITPGQEWGSGAGYRCLYRVKDVKPIQIRHIGRPGAAYVQAQKEQARRLYQEGKKNLAIGRELGVSYQTVNTWVNQWKQAEQEQED